MKYFIYCRKSSEDERRQVLSILSQEREVERRFFGQPNIEIVEIFREERSAMTPGRPIFDAMLTRIVRGEAQGIIAWAPDRLSRNSIDGGRVVYMLDRCILLDLKFATYTFENNSQGKFMLQIMFGQSKYYSDALSENVRRGIRTKLENGWLPGQAPIGYRNHKEDATIVPDQERYPLIERMFEMLLTGAYSVEQIREESVSWGLRTRQKPRLGGKSLSLSGVYRIFSNPFYAGVIEWKGAWHPGKHRAMITLDQYTQIGRILGRVGRPQAKRHTFAYTGLMQCGSCGLMITAEKHTNRFGSEYVYYRCTKRQRPRCTERFIEVRFLEAQMRSFLGELELDDSAHDWLLRQIEKESDAQRDCIGVKNRAIERTIADLERRISELTDMRAGTLITDAEFIEKREAAKRELMRLRQSQTGQAAKDAHWFEPAREIVSFSNRAVSWFDEGNDEERRLIIHAVGSNLSLSRRKLNIQARKVFRHVPREPDLPSWRAFVKNIRKMMTNGDLDEPIAAIRELKKLSAARLFNPGDVPEVPMSEAA